jgi:hypothetical protein
MRVHLSELIDHHVSSSTDVTARFGVSTLEGNADKSQQ